MKPAPPVTIALTLLSYAAVFVTFEGLDGSGKTTQARLLVEWLSKEREVVATREPGGTPLGERVREVLLHGDDVSPWAEAALFAAARAELVARVIRPALERGAAVVCDRYVDSSLAYQGIARGLGIEPVLELNLAVVGGLLPDRTFVLLLDPAQGARRTRRARDRIEQEGEEFHHSLDAAYRRLAELYPERIVALDGSLRKDELAAQVRAALS
jgi:dTMP kinase